MKGLKRNLTIAADDDTSIEIDLPGITGTLRATMMPPGTMLIDGQPVDSIAPPSPLAPARITLTLRPPATNRSATASPSPRHSVILPGHIICNHCPYACSTN